MHRTRSGQSLLEVTLAIVLLAGTLVPALRLMRQALEQSRELERRNLLVSLAMGKLEERLAVASNSWSNGTVTGTFANLGAAELRFSVVHSDAAGDGGLTDRLMTVTCTAWHDADANGQIDAGESYVTFASKISKLVGYPA